LVPEMFFISSGIIVLKKGGISFVSRL